jgi:integrase/recombinase XerD
VDAVLGRPRTGNSASRAAFTGARHNFATNLIRLGANLRVTQTLMRRESLATTAKYTAVDEDERVFAVHNLRAIT